MFIHLRLLLCFLVVILICNLLLLIAAFILNIFCLFNSFRVLASTNIFRDCFIAFSTRRNPYREASNSLLVARPQLEVAAMIIVSLSPYLHLRRRPTSWQRWCTQQTKQLSLFIIAMCPTKTQRSLCMLITLVNLR